VSSGMRSGQNKTRSTSIQPFAEIVCRWRAGRFSQQKHLTNILQAAAGWTTLVIGREDGSRERYILDTPKAYLELRFLELKRFGLERPSVTGHSSSHLQVSFSR
jgi:hypothetical protein